MLPVHGTAELDTTWQLTTIGYYKILNIVFCLGTTFEDLRYGVLLTWLVSANTLKKIVILNFIKL